MICISMGRPGAAGAQARPWMDVPGGAESLVPVLLLVLGFAGLLLGVSLVLAYRFARAHRKEARARQELEALVRERTDQLAEATLDARNARRSRSEFLSTMSHELRTPLNSVIGFSKILLRRADRLDEREKDFLVRIQRSGEHLLELINDVLDLSRIEAGRLDVRPEPTDIRDLVDDTIRKTREEARRRGLSLEVEGPGPRELPPVWVDPARLEQVLLNLLENALKFTPDGEIRVRIVAPDGRVEALEVEDTGIGISPTLLERVFEPFQQGETSTARRYQGSGLGLSIARRLCELMECTLEVRSLEGRGTVFRVGLPGDATPELPDAEELEAVVESMDERFHTVLVIDDEEDARTLLVELLGSLGSRTVTAASGAAGLRIARQLRPDLITLDLRMKGMDGWETLRALKRDPVTREIPVVVVSVIASESRGELLGPVDVVDKPVDREVLEAAVRRNLRGRPGRVLAVDDDADVREMYEELLGDRVEELRTAEDGRHALEILDEYDPGLILLDLVMPRMDGFAFLRSVRDLERHRDIPVVVVTSRDLSPEETHTLESAGVDFLRKEEGDALASLRDRLGSYLTPAIPEP